VIPGIKPGEEWYGTDVGELGADKAYVRSLELSRGNRAWCEAIHRGDWSGVGSHEGIEEPFIYVPAD
jgi:hypothetical protein